MWQLALRQQQLRKVKVRSTAALLNASACATLLSSSPGMSKSAAELTSQRQPWCLQPARGGARAGSVLQIAVRQQWLCKVRSVVCSWISQLRRLQALICSSGRSFQDALSCRAMRQKLLLNMTMLGWPTLCVWSQDEGAFSASRHCSGEHVEALLRPDSLEQAPTASCLGLHCAWGPHQDAQSMKALC